jgi:hypothetical protein
MRTPLNWTLAQQGDATYPEDYKRRLNVTTNPATFVVGPSNAAGCPPGYTAFQSSEDTYPNSSIKIVKCLFSCPTLAPGDPTQTTLNEAGQCLVGLCPNNEITGGQYKAATNNGTANNYTDSNGNTIIANSTTKVCDRSITASGVSLKTTRTFSLPVCPSGKSAQFIDSTNTYINETSVGSVAATNENYRRYFSCTNTCPAGEQRVGNYCMPPCPDDGELNAIVNNATNSANSQYFESVVYPKTAPKQSRCLIKAAANQTKTSTAPDLPSDITVDATCSSGQNVPRWKPAVGPDATTTAKWAALSPSPLYQFDTSTPAETLYSTNKACVASSVCGASNYAVGFRETKSGSTVTTQIFCATRAASCANQGSGFTADAEFANLCLRKFTFNDPAEENASLCSGSQTLYGTQTTIIDKTVSTPFYAGIGYASEILPSSFEISASIGAYSPTQTYDFDEVVGMNVDLVEYFNADGVTPFVASAANPFPQIPNNKQGFVTGPFFRCIQGHTGNGTSNLPILPANSSMYKQLASVPIVSNAYWTTASIPSRVVWENARTAGVDGFKANYCSQPKNSSGDYDFCPQMCSDMCGGPTSTARSGNRADATWNNDGNGPKRYDTTIPNTLLGQIGLIETVYESSTTNNVTTVTGAFCYPRCGSSGQYASSGNLCLSKASAIEKFSEPGFSWCPDNSGNSQATTNNIAPSNPAGPTGIPTNNVCYSECPEGMMVSNEAPQTICVTECPKDTRFQDKGSSCVKIPYLRSAKDATNQSTEDQTESAETGFSATASQIAKVGLLGGSSTLFTSVLYASIACFFIVGVLFVIKFQSAKFH